MKSVAPIFAPGIDEMGAIAFKFLNRARKLGVRHTRSKSAPTSDENKGDFFAFHRKNRTG